MAAGLFGHMSEYDAIQEDWEQYSQRLDYYFAANSVIEANMKKAVLLGRSKRRNEEIGNGNEEMGKSLEYNMYK